MIDSTIVRIPIIRRFPNAGPLIVGVLLATGIAVLDWVTGPQVSFSLLYVIAVMSVTWLGTRRHGALVAGLAASQSLFAAFAGDGLASSDVWNAVMLLGVLLVVSVLVVALRTALLEQRRHATLDPLTGAMNRRAFSLIAERERLRAGRDGSPLTLAYFDIDDFKTVNDARGHSAGDAVLTAFAGAATDTVRGTDLFARLGGDEFVLMLPETDAREAMVVVDRVRRLLGDTCKIDGKALTTSVGLATFRFPPSTVDAMIAGADDLMYQAKNRGGDTVVGMVFVGPWTRWSRTMAGNEPALVPLERLPVGG
ncbi:MAG TPA: GGDEF domain-containing protein [Acidimicrobiia bacterium]|nr:GGDEF domain-containing protein [Acidimicrobiia bacterium]